MIVFDLAYELTLGAVCAAWDRKRLGSGAPVLSGAGFSDGLLLSALVYVPLCVAGLVAWPGWQSMYLLELERGGVAAGLFAGVSSAALIGAFVLGYYSSARLLRGGGIERIAIPLSVLWPLLLALLFGVLWRRAFTVTSYADFQAGVTARLAWGAPGELLGGEVALFLLASSIVNAAGVAAIYLRARRRQAGGSVLQPS